MLPGIQSSKKAMEDVDLFITADLQAYQTFCPQKLNSVAASSCTMLFGKNYCYVIKGILSRNFYTLVQYVIN